jgi:hypothetical protein
MTIGSHKNQPRSTRARAIESTPYALDAVDQKIIKLLIRFPKITQYAVAKEIDMSMGQTRKRINKPAVQEALTELAKNAMDQIKDVQADAMRTLRDLLRSKNETIKLQAVKLALASVFDAQDSGNEMTVTYRVRFGEQGQMYREKLEGDTTSDPEYPNTLDIMKDDAMTVDVTRGEQ